jgi:hypothetical protein
MQKLGLGAVIGLTLAVLAYAAIIAFRSDHPRPLPQTAAQRSPQDLAARERMAKLVAEVAARSAAQTARTVVLEHLHRQAVRTAPENAAEVTSANTVADNK